VHSECCTCSPRNSSPSPPSSRSVRSPRQSLPCNHLACSRPRDCQASTGNSGPTASLLQSRCGWSQSSLSASPCCRRLHPSGGVVPLCVGKVRAAVVAWMGSREREVPMNSDREAITGAHGSDIAPRKVVTSTHLVSQVSPAGGQVTGRLRGKHARYTRPSSGSRLELRAFPCGGPRPSRRLRRPLESRRP
jgi:hypothetical protein